MEYYLPPSRCQVIGQAYNQVGASVLMFTCGIEITGVGVGVDLNRPWICIYCSPPACVHRINPRTHTPTTHTHIYTPIYSLIHTPTHPHTHHTHSHTQPPHPHTHTHSPTHIYTRAHPFTHTPTQRCTHHKSHNNGSLVTMAV